MTTPTEQDRVRAQFAGPLLLSLVYSVFSLYYGGTSGGDESWLHYIQFLVYAAAWLNARYIPTPNSLHSAAVMLPLGLILSTVELNNAVGITGTEMGTRNLHDIVAISHRRTFVCGLLALLCASVFSLISYFMKQSTAEKKT